MRRAAADRAPSPSWSGCSGCSSGTSRTRAAARSRANVDEGKVVAGARFTRPRVDSDGKHEPRVAAREGRRPQLLAVVLRAVHARGAGRSRAAAKSWQRQGRRLRRRRRAGPARAGARSSSSASTSTTRSSATAAPLVGHYGVTGLSGDVLRRPARAASSPPHIVGAGDAAPSSTKGDPATPLRADEARSAGRGRRAGRRVLALVAAARSRASSIRRRASSRPSSSARRATRRSTSPTRRSRSR